MGKSYLVRRDNIERFVDPELLATHPKGLDRLASIEDVPQAERDSLRPLYGDQDFEGFANIGGFAGYRIVITDSGEWLYFIAGD